jgi:hypothetical protein
MSSKVRVRNYRRYRLAQLLDMAAYKCVQKAAIKNLDMARQFYLRCERFRTELIRA